MWRCCCCCCCCCLVVVTIEKPSQHRSTIQACPKKGKQARAHRAGIEPGTFRRKPVPPDHETKPPRSLEPPRKQRNRLQHQAKARICGTYHAKRLRTEVDTSLCASLRSRNALRHQARARICGTYHAKRSRTEVGTSLCASLRSRNALRHQARARTCGKYHAKTLADRAGTAIWHKAFSLGVRSS